ncbi:UNVERIFIED_CONTAM: hypothetical protein RMT77_015900 [Armadillidium vulgare]
MLDQPSYSYDLTPVYYCLFPKLKTHLKIRAFDSILYINKTVTCTMNTIAKKDFHRGSQTVFTIGRDVCRVINMFYKYFFIFKMIHLFLLIILILNFGISNCKAPIFIDEPECTVAGGVCLHLSSCDDVYILPDGLCPTQCDKEAICCKLNPVHGDCLKKMGGVCVNGYECNLGDGYVNETLCKKPKICCVYKSGKK